MNNPADNQTADIKYLDEPRALEDGLQLGRAGIWRWRIDSEKLDWTRNLESVHNLPAGSFDGTPSSFQRDIHPDDAEAVWRKIVESIESGIPYQAVYRTAPRPGGGELWIETTGGVAKTPDGALYLTGICLDVTARVQNEQQLQRRLAQQHAISRFGSFALNKDSQRSL